MERTSTGRERTTRDESTLRLLAVFHYALAALWAFLAVLPLWAGRFAEPGASPLEWSGLALSLWSIVLGLAAAAATFLAGTKLTRRRNRSFCMFVAAVNCFFFPFGTALGVATLIVLKRPSMQAAFGSARVRSNVAAWENRTPP
jgi:hypothetical protein